MAEHPNKFKKLYDALDPVFQDLPSPWDRTLSSEFLRLQLVRVLRPDKLVPGMQRFVSATMGRQFVEPPAFDLSACLADSTATSPLIFVLSPGSDPMSALLAQAEAQRAAVETISLGQGQGPKAEALVGKAKVQVRRP